MPAAAPSSVAAAATSRPAVQSSRPNGITPQERTMLNDRLAHLEDALFDYDKSTIRSDAATALKDDVGVIRDILAKDPNEKLRIEGHCDERGSDEYNMALGDKRAQAAAEFFQTMGIPSAQLTVISYGKEKPVCTERTEACWQKNRRAHIVAQN
jgi:peptidoglycan-associated lipoprotein